MSFLSDLATARFTRLLASGVNEQQAYQEARRLAQTFQGGTERGSADR